MRSLSLKAKYTVNGITF